jgi:hypothetical protein
MTAVNGGSNWFVRAVFSLSEAQDMYLNGPNGTQIWTDSNRNFTLRQYGRLEYGSPDVGWILASVMTSRRRVKRPGRSLRVRLRYFLNSFRGFAAFDFQDRDSTRY